MVLHNKYDKATLRKKLESEDFQRITLSFYRYVLLDNLESFRNDLYRQFETLGVLGRIFIAREGINAQLSVPGFNLEKLRAMIDSIPAFSAVPFKIAREENKESFYKLIVRIRTKIVADGLDDGSYDVTNVGRHLTAREWNEAMEQPGTVVVDMRNHYESEIGHFRNAVLPQADTFKEELPMVLEQLRDKKDKKILLYSTGGIRCEKASAYLKHHGFDDVNQLHGGIIDYARQVTEENLETKFVGKNFVFDDRLGERITGEIISACHQCGAPCDNHVNCANDACHLLFIQCDDCAAKMNACCTPACMEILSLPVEEQRQVRRSQPAKATPAGHKSRLRPRLSDILKSEPPL